MIFSHAASIAKSPAGCARARGHVSAERGAVRSNQERRLGFRGDDMSADSFTRPRTHRARRLVTTVLALACSALAACDRGQVTSPTAPRPTPTPALPPQPVTTPAPFGLTESRTFDILGWDSWPAAPMPSAIQFRWNASIRRYEVLPPGYDDWNRLEPRTSFDYDVFGSNGTKLPFYMPLWTPPAPPPTGGYVGNARIFEQSSARAYFAFGIATDPADVPVTGTMTCSFGEDEIGDGGLTFDLARGTVSGSVAPFWAAVRYQLEQTSFAPGATTFAATFGTAGILEGRFFGPGAVNVAVRAKGGGQGFAAVSGIMTGVCGE